MTVVRHELRQGRTAWWIWTAAISSMLVVCVFLFPEMKGEMEQVSEIFGSMGSFTAAFGMDRLNFGSLIGYYAIECGNVLGLGGAFYAALTAAASLSGEERDRTAEFLLTHPVSRTRVVGEKLVSLLLRVLALNVVVFALSLGSMTVVGEDIPWKEVCLLHLAYTLLTVELVGICFGISAFLRRGSAGIGLGIAALFYVMNLLANIAEKAAFLKELTPFGFCDGAQIVSDGCLDGGRIVIGLALFALGIWAAFLYYPRKDIR